MTPDTSPLIGESPAIKRLRAMIERIASSNIPVLVHGETGSGKELVAGELHRRSGRTGACVAFNVCAVGESMFEDALFGHVRGAYTGALGESLGFLREANGGTLVLDEISGLAVALQAKLLRAVETGVFRPIGSARDARSDFRTVAATNEPMDVLIGNGRFRPDLAHRLSGIVLTVPPLRDRPDDIPLLARHFIAHDQRLHQHARRPPIALTRRAEQMLVARDWPGNVRELRQVVQSALVFAGDTLDVDALDAAMMHRPAASLPADAPNDPLRAERERLVALLDGAAWDTARLANSLGVHRATLYRRAKRLGIRLPSRAGSWLNAPHVQ